MQFRSLRLAAFGLCLIGLIPLDSFAGFDETGTIEIAVDLRESPRRLLHSRLTIPVKPGPLTLLYPKWIPGDHGPTGPINELANLRIVADGQVLSWKRDEMEMFAFHCIIPDRISSIEVSFDMLGIVPDGGQSGHVSSTPNLSILNWNEVLLYPSGHPSDSLKFHARLTLPEGWNHGTALTMEGKADGNQVAFKPCSLTSLIDAPVIAGKHFRSLDLAPGSKVDHRLELAVDSATDLELPRRVVDGYRRLVAETGALFGSRHYREYHFLLALSDPVGHFGLEHHESSENRLPERSFLDTELLKTTASLLPHEMVHSWNGKFRRPARLTSPDYNKPVYAELLWIYEGLTTYLGRILPARSGLWSAEDFRDHLAVVAADAEHYKGRAWRSLSDAATSAPKLYGTGDAWAFRRWSADASFYDGGELLWLEVDATIRSLSEGKKSLDDFCRAFYGGEGGKPAVSFYEIQDIVTALDKVASHDWAKFFAERVNVPLKDAPLGGLERSGWKLTYGEESTEMFKAIEKSGKWGFDDPMVNLTYSLGLLLNEDGTVVDVVPGLASDRAGISPSVKIIAVNGRRFSPTLIRDAVKASKADKGPIDLLTEDGDFFKNHAIDYHEGARYPRLERIKQRPDSLSKILEAKVSP